MSPLCQSTLMRYLIHFMSVSTCKVSDNSLTLLTMTPTYYIYKTQLILTNLSSGTYNENYFENNLRQEINTSVQMNFTHISYCFMLVDPKEFLVHCKEIRRRFNKKNVDS
jgi:hypothetical protein